MPLEAPHHFRISDEWAYREGVTTDIPSKDGKGSWVDIGLMNVNFSLNRIKFK